VTLNTLSKLVIAFILGMSPILSAAANQSMLDTVRSWQLEELAATFSDEKTDRCLVNYPVEGDAETRRAGALLACLGQDPFGSNRPPQVLVDLENTGKPDWLLTGAHRIEIFEEKLRKAMVSELTTGYNIVPIPLWPEFDVERTVIYGHSDWKHARQLIALLITEGLKIKVTALVKKSAFLYRDKWGEPAHVLPTLTNGHRYIDQLEYDLFIEFAKPSDIAKFVELVNRYAKKDSESEGGLIHGAWWQPFYRTLVSRPNAHELSVMLVSSDGYRTNLMALPELMAPRLPKLQAIDVDWQIETFSIWVNPGFYRNQLGDYR